jgi:hypothetical protein
MHVFSSVPGLGAYLLMQVVQSKQPGYFHYHKVCAPPCMKEQPLAQQRACSFVGGGCAVVLHALPCRLRVHACTYVVVLARARGSPPRQCWSWRPVKPCPAR